MSRAGVKNDSSLMRHAADAEGKNPQRWSDSKRDEPSPRAARLENVAALVVVIHTSEESQRTVGCDRLREGDGARRYREGVDVVARQVGLFCVERG